MIDINATNADHQTVKPQQRIAIFIASLAGGGGERSMLNLAHGIADRGYAVDLVLARAEGPFMDEVREPVRIVDLKASRVLTRLPARVRYCQGVSLWPSIRGTSFRICRACPA